VARSKTCALLSLGLKLKSKPDRAARPPVGRARPLEGFGGIEGRAAQPQPELALGAAFDFVLQEDGEELDEGGLLLDGLAIADVERLQDAGQAQGAEHRGELMGQFHRDRSSSAPGSGKKVVQGRAWRAGGAGPAAATGVREGSGCASSAWARIVFTVW
jgi:hypothetical protein